MDCYSMSLFLNDLTPDMAMFFESTLASEGEQESANKTATGEGAAWDTHTWHPNHPLKTRPSVHDSSLSDISSSDECTSCSTFRPSHKHSLSQGSNSSDDTSRWGTVSPPASCKGIEQSPMENNKGVLPQRQPSASDGSPFSEDFELSTKDYINWLISSTDQEDGCDEEEEEISWSTPNKPQTFQETTASSLGRSSNSKRLSSASTSTALQSQPVIDLSDREEDQTTMPELKELLDLKLFEPSLRWLGAIEKGEMATAVAAAPTSVAAAAPPQQPWSAAQQPPVSLQSCHPFQNDRFDLTQNMLLWPFPTPNLAQATATTLGCTPPAMVTPPQPRFTLVDTHEREGSPAKKTKRKPSKRPPLPSSSSSSSTSSFFSSSSSAIEALPGTLLGSGGSGHFLPPSDGTATSAFAAAAVTPSYPRSIPNPGYHPTNTNHAHTPVFRPHIAQHYLHQLSLAQAQSPHGGSGSGMPIHPLTRRATVDGSLSASSSSSSLPSLPLSSSTSSTPFVHPGFYSLSSQVKNVPPMEAEVSGDGGTVAAMTAAPASHVQDDGAVANRSWPSGQASPKTNTTGSSRTTTTTQQTSPTSSSSSSNGRNGAGESNGSNDLTASNMIRKRKSLDQGSSNVAFTPLTPPTTLSSSPISCSSSSSPSFSHLNDQTTPGVRLSPSSSSSSSSTTAATETAATVVATAAAVDSAQTLGGGVPRGQPFVAAFPIQSPEHLQVMRMLQLGCGEKIRGGYEEGGSKRSGSGPTSTSPLATTSMPGPALVPEGRKKSKTLPIMGSVHSQQAQAQEFRGSMSRAYGHELTSGNLSTATTPSSVSGSSAAAAACTPTPTTTALNNIRQLHQQLNQGLGLCHGSPAPVMQGIPLMTTNAGLRLGTQDIGAKPSTAAATIPSSAPTAASASGSVRHAAPPTHAAFHHYPQAGIPPPLMSSRPPSYPPPGYLESETGYFPPPSSRRPGSPMHPHTPPGGRGIGVGGGGALMHGTASSPSGGMMPAGMMARKPNPAEVPPSVLPADFFVLEEAVLARRRASASEVYRRNL